MTARAELRWILPGELPPPVLEWLAPRRAPELRVDHYLLGRLRPDLGAKRRDGNPTRVQVKEQFGEPIPLVVGPGCVGLLQHWSKQSVRDRERTTAAETIAVAKRRWRRGGLEVVDIEVDRHRAWSVALQLRCPGGDVLDGATVQSFADRRLARFPLPEPLTTATSWSYPEWLLAFGPGSTFPTRLVASSPF